MNTKEVRSNNKACDKRVSRPISRPIFDVQFFTCPANYYRESYAFWFDISRNIENGTMSFNIEDPNRNFEAINFVNSLRSNYQQELMKEVGNGR